MKKVLFIAAIFACIAFVSCSKTCKCTLVSTGEEWAAEATEHYTETQCDLANVPGMVECKMQ